MSVYSKPKELEEFEKEELENTPEPARRSMLSDLVDRLHTEYQRIKKEEVGKKSIEIIGYVLTPRDYAILTFDKDFKRMDENKFSGGRFTGFYGRGIEPNFGGYPVTMDETAEKSTIRYVVRQKLYKTKSKKTKERSKNARSQV